MKKIYLLLTFIVILFSGNKTFAQENVPKEILLTTLNNVNKLKLSNLKTEELMNYNKGFVDKVYDILDSDKTEKDKKTALEALNTGKEKDLNDLLGKNESKKYLKLMEEELKPLTKKNKLLKNLV
jgi:hypothetical protein